jgi:Protein of unknown function (DUF3996)
MKRLVIVGLVVAMLGGVAQAKGSSGSGGGPFAFGLILGEPTGLSGKLFVSRRNALDFGLGFGSGYYDDHGTRVHVDYLWHPQALTKNATFVLPFYIGIGGIIWDSHRYDNRVGIGPRVPFGLDMYFRGAPIDVFLELAFAMDLIGDRDVDHDRGRRAWVEAALGVRYSF